MYSEPILVAGATGYVGGRLIPELLEAGYRVRALGRHFEKLPCRPWASHPKIELVHAGVLDGPSLQKATTGCRAAFYLVRSMIAQKKRFADADRRAAHHMVAAATDAGLERIIYLGGLAEGMLVTQMKTPGKAVWEFYLNPFGHHRTEIRILSRFLQMGLAGILYWYVLYPSHELIFSGMIKAIAKSVGKTISLGPRRFTLKLHDARPCRTAERGENEVHPSKGLSPNWSLLSKHIRHAFEF